MNASRLPLAMWLAVSLAGVMGLLCPQRARGADPEVVQRLEQVIVLREAEAELQRQLATEGQSDEGVAEIALCRARIDLAQELGRPGDIRAQLQQILTIRQARFQRARATLADTIGTRQTLRNLEIDILQAEIELRRAQGMPR